MSDDSQFDLLFTPRGLAERLSAILDAAHNTATAESKDIVIQRLSECGQLRGELLAMIADLRLAATAQEHPNQYRC